jgi:23S rRNA pseudouridine2605 synthase
MIEEWIKQGRVLKNNIKAELGDVLVGNDEIKVLDIDGSLLYRATLRGVYDNKSMQWLKKGYEYWMLNKPKGVLASTRDPHHSRMVTHLVPSSMRLFPVGRLDKDSEGLLLLTSDGDLCHKLIHPRYGINKVYHVTLDWPPSDDSLKRIEAGGVLLDDGPTMPIGVKRLGARRFQLTLREGRKREVRRLFSVFGNKVIELERVAFGPLKLSDLPPGKARELTEEEVSLLKRAVTKPYHPHEKRPTTREIRRPGSARPGHLKGRRSSKSSARSKTRKGSRW